MTLVLFTLAFFLCKRELAKDMKIRCSYNGMVNIFVGLKQGMNREQNEIRFFCEWVRHLTSIFLINSQGLHYSNSLHKFLELYEIAKIIMRIDMKMLRSTERGQEKKTSN